MALPYITSPTVHAVSRWMFPWERRQMDEKGPLKTWEKLYWGVFVGTIALLLFNRLPGQKPEPVDPEVLPFHIQAIYMPYHHDV